MSGINKKKILAVVVGVVLLGSFVSLVLGFANYLVFLAVAAFSAVFAYKVIPRME